MKLGVVGLGYVGLSAAVCFGKKFRVVGIDVDKERVLKLNRGEATIHEKGLPALLKDGIARGALAFTEDFESLRGVDFVIIAVSTPSNHDGSINLTQVKNASRMIGRQLGLTKKRPVVVVKSTVTPGTATTVIKPLLEKESGKTCGDGFGLCSNPEFLREGEAIEDTMLPERVVLGPLDRRSGRAIKSLYRTFYGRRT
ncbi:MAG TPA: nucleotide sugar dehydrogenase, partial [Nitrospira sp.]|nr:nucleotide sugar dehydrogenase [Nitrospira sp.]